MPSRRLLIAAVCAFAAFSSPAAAQAVDLFGTVGPDFTISLRNAQGQNVTQLDPGAYRIVVQDRSDFHNFHLSGPGVGLATDIESVETVTWEVTLVEGRYTFVCDPHATDMRGSFTVGNPPPPPVPVRLVATVGPSNTISLTRNGARVRTLTAGAYAVVVRDRSKRHNFHLTGPGVNRRTAVGRTGTVTWNLRLGAGTFRYVSDPQAKRVRGTFAVR
jgi:opacity protein-like surface antigen